MASTGWWPAISAAVEVVDFTSGRLAEPERSVGICRGRVPAGGLKRDEITLRRHRALASCLGMIFSETLRTFLDHALDHMFAL